MDDVQEIANAIINEVSRFIVGKEEVIKMVLSAILSGGHILFEDNPGLGKTMLARTIAQTMGCDFKRVQFTPDLLPADITGTYIFDRKTGDFKLYRGPIFTNILLADEINRAPPKTQSALLEAMQELQVTLEGETYKLDEPFVVIATQNPIEYEGTYPLPEAQLDRFLIRLRMGYPTLDEEIEILKRREDRKSDMFFANEIIEKRELLNIREKIENVVVEDSIKEYIVKIVHATRNNRQVEVGASPRGSLAIFKMARAYAAINGRDFVIPDDVKKVVLPCLSHRIILKPEPWIRGVKPEDIIQDILKEVPVPKVR